MSKFTINTSDFVKTLSNLPTISSKYNYTLSMVKITIGDNIIRIESTDKDNYVNVIVDACTTGEGEFLVDVALLKKAIGKSKEAVTVEVNDDSKISVITGTTIVTLDGYKTEDFPKPEAAVNRVKLFTVDADTFGMAFDTVSYAVGPEKMNGLCGVMIEVNDNSLDFVTSDTFRLATINVKAEIENKANVNYLISTLKIASKLAKSGKITVYTNTNEHGHTTGVTLCGDNFTICACIHDGQFPRWREVIPTKGDFKFILPVVETIKKVKELIPFTNSYCSVESFIKDGKITFRASGTESVVTIDGDTTGFWGFVVNANYLIQALEQCDGYALVHMSEGDPIRIEDNISVHVISPINNKDLFVCRYCGKTHSDTITRNIRTNLSCCPECAEKAEKACLDGTVVTYPDKTVVVKSSKEFKVTSKMVKDLLSMVKATTSAENDEEAWKFIVEKVK